MSAVDHFGGGKEKRTVGNTSQQRTSSYIIDALYLKPRTIMRLPACFDEHDGCVTVVCVTVADDDDVVVVRIYQDSRM